MTHRECGLWPQFLAESFSYRTHNLRASTVQCPYIVYTLQYLFGAARSGAADSRSMNPARHRIVSHCNEQSCFWCLLCYVLGFCLPHVLCVSFVADSHWSSNIFPVDHLMPTTTVQCITNALFDFSLCFQVCAFKSSRVESVPSRANGNLIKALPLQIDCVGGHFSLSSTKLTRLQSLAFWV